jgi:hypothetical protein
MNGCCAFSSRTAVPKLRTLSLFLLVWLGISRPTALAQASQNNSASGCASCHAAQSATQSHTPMGQALQFPGSDLALKAHPKLTIQKGGFTYTVETQGDKSTYSITDGKQTIALPIHWNFGIGMQTWVFERDGQWYEGLVSYYPDIAGLDTTIGDDVLTPHTVDEAVGRKLLPSEIKDCFNCHATRSSQNGKLTLDSMQAGVTCEHCHSGSSTHMLDALQGDYETAPPKLAKLSSEDLSGFCGQCHRTWDTVVRNRWRGVVDVRFQPYRLANSKCFDGTDPRISCLACHDPHKDVVRETSSYDSKCLVCHATSTHPSSPQTISASAKIIGKTCPVAQADCVSCHMPKVTLPGGHAIFTDHQIRIVKAGEPFPN